MRVLASYNVKGGVGKTTTAVNLAYEAARRGERVLLWDLDPQGAATFLFRIKPLLSGGARKLVRAGRGVARQVHATDFSGVHVVPADFTLRHLDLHLKAGPKPRRQLTRLLEPVEGRYDLAVLDCPPGITLTSESMFRAVDALAVPVIPTPLSARSLTQLRMFLAEQRGAPRLLPFFSMVDRDNKLHADAVAYLQSREPGFLSSRIPLSTLVERMGLERAPLGAFAPQTSPAVAFRRLEEEISSLMRE